MASIKNEIKKLREDFMKGKLSESEIKKDPFKQFEMWLSEAMAAGVPEVQAMVLSTVSKKGKPSSRIVYLRELNKNLFWFYTNYKSKKAKDLAGNPNVALNFFWPGLERQIRIEGTVSLAKDSHSDAYFNNRPLESKLGAWASEQSGELTSRKHLEDLVEAVRKKYKGKNIPRPGFWGGYIVKANYYEFWQGRPSRLHDRIVYKLVKGKWKMGRLGP